jgi:alkanesulfonate monooxygenase
MSTDFLWYLPTHGDSRHLAGSAALATIADAFRSATRKPSIGYLTEVALAAERSGFSGTLIPTGPSCEDAWLVAAAVAQQTRHLRPLVAFRPGFVLPAVAAQSAATLQRFTGGRLLLNVVTGGSSQEQRGYGDFLDHDARYERTAEYLSIVRGIWRGPGFSFEGKHHRIENGGLVEPLTTVPTIYFGGASPAAERVAAAHADVYLAWGEPPPMVKERFARVQALATGLGRKLRFGIRLHVITRDTEADAWAEADRLLQGIPPGAIEEAERVFAATDSVGQHRMASLNRGKRGRVRDLEIYPNLWAGVGLVRGGAGTAIVGSHDQVVGLLREYRSVGIDTFILSAYPNLEEAYRVGEEVLPRYFAEEVAQGRPTSLAVAVS